jgi:hypothetical protein
MVTHAEHPEHEARTQEDDFLSQWPQFMFHDPVADEHYPTMYELCSEFQFYILDESGTVVATGNSIPILWDGSSEDLPDGWDDALIRGTSGARSGIEPNTLCALQATASSQFAARGLGGTLVQAMRQLAADAGMTSLLAPVRPSHKADYPLIPIDEYVTWKREDGMAFDPWLRVHERAGAQTLKSAHDSMEIPGSAADWASWTGMVFPTTGSYIVPGALAPVHFDADRDLGIYTEPNVWMVHHV